AKYHDDLTMEDCLYNVDCVLAKREVQNAILTGIQLDKLAEANKLEEPLQKLIETDEGLYGIDEIIAFSIVNVYGSIGLDRKSTRLNSSHVSISYAVFCLKKK